MGLKSQLMVGIESTYGTYQAPTRAHVFESEGLQRRNRTLQSDGLRGAGRTLRWGASRDLVGHDAGGPVRLPVPPDSIGWLFEHALGAVATATPAGATNAREHTFTMGSLTGKSFTVQKGVEGADGTVVPLSYLGCKVTQLQLSISSNGYLMADVTIDAREEVDDEALEVAAVAGGGMFHFQHAGISTGGSPLAKVGNASLTIANNLKTDDYFLGNSGLKDEPTADGYPDVNGEAAARFSGLDAFHTAFQADTVVDLELSFVRDEIEAGFNEELTITLPDVRWGDGATPTVSGPRVPDLRVPFAAFDPEAGGEPITVLLRNADAAA